MRDLFRRLREELGASSTTTVAREAPGGTVAFAVLDSRVQAAWPRPRLAQEEGEGIDESDAETVWDKASSFLRDLLRGAEENRLHFKRLPIKSTPEHGARVCLWPPSELFSCVDGVEETDSEVEDVWRGLYYYKVSHRKYADGSCQDEKCPPVKLPPVGSLIVRCELRKQGSFCEATSPEEE